MKRELGTSEMVVAAYWKKLKEVHNDPRRQELKKDKH